jgi:uncharacterized protein YpbB
MDQFAAAPGASMVRPSKKGRKPNGARDQAMRMFAEGCSVDEIAAATGRARSTIGGYLAEWIVQHKPADVIRWVSDASYQRVREAARGLEGRSMKPVFESLNGEVPYQDIRIVIAHMEATAAR